MPSRKGKRNFLLASRGIARRAGGKRWVPPGGSQPPQNLSVVGTSLTSTTHNSRGNCKCWSSPLRNFEVCKLQAQFPKFCKIEKQKKNPCKFHARSLQRSPSIPGLPGFSIRAPVGARLFSSPDAGCKTRAPALALLPLPLPTRRDPGL